MDECLNNKTTDCGSAKVPLTQSQLGMYLEWNADRQSTQYNVCLDNCFEKGSIDAVRLAEALRKVFATYSVFRLHFVEADGEILQFVDDAFLPSVEEREATEAEMPRVCETFKRPFNPFVEPMARALVVTTESKTHLLTDMFHLITDGTDFHHFNSALAAAYEGRELPREAMAFADYALVEPTLFEREAYARAKAEHAARFAGKTMTIPDAGEGPAKLRPEMKNVLISATAIVPRSGVESFCRANEVHPNLFFMGAFARTLSLYANTKEPVFFTVNHGRRDARLKETFGCFVKSIPVAASLQGDKPLAQVLRGLRLHNVGDYPFTHFCRDLGIVPGFGYAFQDGTVKLNIKIGESVSVMTSLTAMGAGHLPTLQVGGDADNYELNLSFLAGAYSEEWCGQFVNRVAEVARQFLVHPDALLEDIPVVSDEEAKSIVAISRGKDLAYDKGATFIDLFDRSVAAHGERTAVVDCDGSITYGELGAASIALGERLIDLGVRPGGFVGVMLPRRLSFVTSVLAVQRCAAGYVPLDGEYPADRLAYMLENSESSVLITTHALFDGKGIAFNGRVLYFDDQVQNANRESQGTKREAPSASSPAYMIYTSGSTGKPKGVVIPQRALVAFCAWVVDEMRLNGQSRMGVTASFSFDASVFDLFPALTVGGEVHLFSESLRKDLAGMRAYAESKKMTGWTMSTQLGLAMLNAYPDVPLDSMVLGGEKIQPFAKTAVRVYNGYGPTEFTVASSFHVVDQDAPGEVPIGRPVPNSFSLICDRFGQLLPRGLVGELCLKGIQIADGYWRNEEKTAKAFVNGCYHTGDYACYDDQGRLHYRGRIDSQVKLRGFRIEMGEIESAAASCPGVEAVAAEVKTLAGTQHLVLYYSGLAASDAVRARMSETLTGYMVPDYFVKLEKMPLTPVGKIDRKALPDPKLDDEPIVEPKNELEMKILAAVRNVLHNDAVGVTHDLDRVGLTSLGAMALVARLKKECGLTITLSELASLSCVRQIAEKFETSVSTAQPVKSKRPKRATYPMTENQRGVYADWLKNPSTLQYNVPAAFRFPGLDADALAAATEKAIAMHSAFKTRFIEKDGEIVQERRDAADLAILRETLDGEPDEAFFASRMRPFVPSGEDLSRFAVYAAPNAAYLFMDAHHTIFDGFSMGVFLQGILAALDGKTCEGEAASAFDAGLDERDYLESELLAEDDQWFANYLGGCESTALEASEPPAQGIVPGTAARASVRVASAAIAKRAAELGVSASDWFLTALMELLRRIGRSDDVQILFVSAGRGNADYANSVGMFVRTLPVRNIKTENTFSATVQRMHSDILALRDHDRASYARIAEKNGLTPEIIFAYEGGLFDLPRGASLLSPLPTAAKFPLSVTVTPGKDDFELCFEYDASRYGRHEMEQLVHIYAHLAEGAIATDALREIPLLDEAAATAATAMAYGGDIDFDSTQTFVDLFEGAVQARPSARAVVDCEGSLTYGELDSSSRVLAESLVSHGVKPGNFVGVMLPRRCSFVTTVIAVQRCAAGYVPLDSEYPADRLAYMLENSEAPVLVTTHALFDSKGIAYGGQVVYFDDQARDTIHEAPGTKRESPGAASPAYMIYTSGSTGKPKGVVVPHRALRHLIEWTRRDREITALSRVFVHASFSFDASVIDIFPVLAAGGELHIFAEELRKNLAGMRDYIVEHGITGGSMSTQIGMALMDAYPDLPLHDIMFGGEKLLPTAKTKVKLLNGYGPTEFCVCSSYQTVNQEAPGDIPIGRAVPGTWSFVVDRYGHLLPQGIAGEIALAGPQIADGYWKNQEKTAKAFVHGRYHTGDLARYDAEGRLLYLGRMDFQVKLRGFRIEIGEIEHTASQYPGVKTVAAEVRDVSGTKHLVLYYEESKATVDIEELKKHLAASLADYMVPDYYVRMDEMPMTPNGKINRKILPVPSAAESANEYVEPREGDERTIAEAWGKLLKIEKYGALDDFFRSGGTSLIGIKAVVALQKAGLDVQYGDLFKHKTPRALAAFIAGETGTAALDTRHSAFAPHDFDYAAIDSVLANTRTDLFKGFRVHSLGDVLLTGATGYLGIHVLRHLLEKTSSSVTVLLRSKGKVGPERRLDAQYVYYFGERLLRRYRDRLDFVEGDITDKDLQAKVKADERAIATVVNCAALVKHYIADDALDRVNVEGVENLLALCEACGARFVQTSTYSIGGSIDAISPVRLDERHLFVGQSSDNDYIRTKFLAERAVLAAVAAGKVRAKIMRLGNLMGREADGEFQMNIGANAFVNSLKSYVAIGAYPLDELVSPLEMSPIDRVAEAVCLLATTPDDMVVFHPYNTYALDMGAVLGALNRRGFAIDWTSRDEFAARVDALRSDPSRAQDLQGILHYAQRHLDGRKMTPVANGWTTSVLYRLGFRWKPAEDLYLANFFNMLEGLAAFD